MDIRMACDADFAQWLPLGQSCQTIDKTQIADAVTAKTWARFLDPTEPLPQWRGKGVGRALIEHVYAKAAQAPASRVWWLTHETNAQAMRLYDHIADKSGFVQYRKIL